MIAEAMDMMTFAAAERIVSSFKRCKCGKSYSGAQWHQLPLLGYMEDEGVKLELRNCACGSTMAVDVS